MLRRITYLIITTFSMLILVGCSLDDQNDIRTRIYEELQKQLTAQAMDTAVSRLTQAVQPSASPTLSPTSSPTPQPPTASSTSTASMTPVIPTNTPRPPTATATPIPCNWAEFVKDVTIKDGTRFLPGESFTKIWRIRNIGSCRWRRDYALVFDKGEIMNGPGVQRLGQVVEPGQTIDIAVNLKAPTKTGEHIGYWLLSDLDRNTFGLGNQANKPFWVEIVVVAPTGTPVTPTSTPTRTPTATSKPPTPTAIPQPCNWAEFIKDISIPDGTILAPGQTFTKIWRLKNIGTCTWTKKYSLIFVSGDQMGGPSAQNLVERVEPSQRGDISVTLKAPLEFGEFKGFWQLRSNSGEVFGIGSNAKTPFWVTIRVASEQKMVYDFTKYICDAQWKSEAGVLPCLLIQPDSEDEPFLNYEKFLVLKDSQNFENGFYSMVSKPKLETNQISEIPVLVLKPDEIENGYIMGEYPLFKVASGDRFLATIGCLADSPKCNVTFQLNYRIEGQNIQTFGIWPELFDGKLTIINFDISFLAGKSVYFSLSVIDNGSPKDDWIFWLQPRIERLNVTAPPSEE